MKLTIEQALQQGVGAHREGKLQDAERLYRAILQSQPAHPDANHNLGVLAVSINKADVALPLFKAALEANPKIENFWLSYIDALIKEKQFDKATQVLEEGKKEGLSGDKVDALEGQLKQITHSALPKSSEKKKSLTLKEERKKVAESKQQKKRAKSKNANRLSPSQSKLDYLLEHYQNGRYDEAEKLAVTITQEFPKHQFAWKVLGQLFGQTGRTSEALNANKKAVALSPQDATARYNLGITFTELNRLDEAEASYKKAITLKSNFVEARYNLGNTLKELGRLNEAEASYTQAIAFKPNYVEAHYNLGVMLKEQGRFGEAEARYRQAIVLKPDYGKAHCNLGETLQVLGKLKEAVAHYRQAITLNPYDTLAHKNLSLSKKFDAQDEQYLRTLQLYLDQNISEEQRCHINFVLAKACEDLGDFEKAFQHYREGNALRKKLLNYDISQDLVLFKQIKSSYPRIERNSLKPENLSMHLVPIFILGMPRSGTTLVEQIISSHSQVTGAGELPFAAQFGVAIASGFSKPNNAALLDFRNKYLDKLKGVSNGNLIVTDKMPHNFRYIGLLAAAFPEAKIVHVKRNPAAVCWGNYKVHFTSKSIGYCYGLDDVVAYYKLYQDLMGFWSETLEERFYDLDYELLTTNQNDETKKLIQYLGLDWDEKCLSPQKNTRHVTTASNLQARKAVYRGSSEKWKNYERFLNGAFDDLLTRYV